VTFFPFFFSYTQWGNKRGAGGGSAIFFSFIFIFINLFIYLKQSHGAMSAAQAVEVPSSASLFTGLGLGFRV